MPDRSAPRSLPLWGVFLATVAVISIALEVGYRLGDHRRRRSQREDKSPLGEMVAATLGLVAFLLAFTFGLAAARFDLRRAARARRVQCDRDRVSAHGLIPEPHDPRRGSCSANTWISGSSLVTHDRLAERLARSEALHERLWVQAVEAGEKGHGTAVDGALHPVGQRRDRPSRQAPRARAQESDSGRDLGALYLVACVGMAVMGYHAGLAGTGRSIAVLAVVVHVLRGHRPDHRSRPPPGRPAQGRSIRPRLRSRLDGGTMIWYPSSR